MKLRYRCPQCKRWLSAHWSDKEDAASVALISIEPIAYLVIIAVAAAGYLLDVWELVATIVAVSSVVGWLLYRGYLRKGRHYYCGSCDKVFSAAYLRDRSRAPQITEIAS